MFFLEAFYTTPKSIQNPLQIYKIFYYFAAKTVKIHIMNFHSGVNAGRPIVEVISWIICMCLCTTPLRQ